MLHKPEDLNLDPRTHRKSHMQHHKYLEPHCCEGLEAGRSLDPHGWQPNSWFRDSFPKEEGREGESRAPMSSGLGVCTQMKALVHILPCMYAAYTTNIYISLTGAYRDTHEREGGGRKERREGRKRS